MSKKFNYYKAIGNIPILRRFPIFQSIIAWFVLSCLVAICVGSATALFLVSLEWATKTREINYWLIALLPIAGFIVGLFFHYWGKDIVTGNNLIIDNIHNPKKIIPLRMAPFILIGTVITHLFGGSAGREGTAIQMGGSISDQFTRIFNLKPRDRQILLIAGMSAGFGSVFGTPLAGAVFGLEVYAIGRIKYNAIFPAFVASILANFVTHSWGVGHTLFAIPNIPTINTVNIIYVIISGIAFGVTARVFSKTTSYIASFSKKKIKYAPLRPLIGGLIIAATVFIMGSTRYIGLGVPIISESFLIQEAPYDFILKLMFTALTLGVGFKGGEVTPLFFIGATLGSTLSWILPLPVALMAGMGFVAVFAGAANTPLACIIMAIELFGVECGVYVAIACIVSYLISGNSGIYSSQIISQPKSIAHYKSKGKSLKLL